MCSRPEREIQIVSDHSLSQSYNFCSITKKNKAISKKFLRVNMNININYWRHP